MNEIHALECFIQQAIGLMDRWVERDTAGALILPVANDLPKVPKAKTRVRMRPSSGS
jgi:hypothetical protein